MLLDFDNNGIVAVTGLPGPVTTIIFVIWAIGGSILLIIFFVMGYEGGIGGAEGVLFSWVGSDNITGSNETSFSDEGSVLELTFPSELWDDDNKCQIYAIMLTPEDDDNFEDSDWIIDIYPNGKDSNNLLEDLWFWFMLAILLVILLALVIITVVFFKM